MLQEADEKTTRRRAPRIVAAVLGATLLAVGISSAALGAVRDGEIMPGVVVAGVELGGVDASTAADLLQDAIDAQLAMQASILVDGTSHDTRPSEAGVSVDVDATIAAAYAAQRDGGALPRLFRQLPATFSSEDLDLVLTFDDDQIMRRAAQIVALETTEPSPGDLTVDPETLEVRTTSPAAGQTLDQAEVEVALRAMLATQLPLDEQGSSSLVTQIDRVTVPSLVGADEVAQVAAQATTALSSDFVLAGPEAGTATITPAQLAPTLGLGSDGDSVELIVDPALLTIAVGDAAASFGKDATDATFDIPRTPAIFVDGKGDESFRAQPATVPILPSAPGTSFDADLAAPAVAAALRRGDHEAIIQLGTRPAAFSTDDAEALGIDMLLSSFTSYHDCCGARVHNIQFLADMVDGTVLQPGEQFSINEISGIRTCASGFRAAGMILNGEIVDSCGGGVSQFGTTTFNAAFFAGAQLDTWKAHSFYISRYPRGREATLNFPSPDIDVRFTNTTDHGMLIKTDHTSTSITVAIYGHDDIEEVTATHGATYDFRSFSTRTKENPALAPGSSRTTQSGAQGFSIDITRTALRADAEPEIFAFTTVYVPKLRIVETNSQTPAPPPPAEEAPAEDAAAEDPA